MPSPATGPRACRFSVRGRLLVDGCLRPGAVVVEDGRIAAVVGDASSGTLPAPVHTASIVAPGLIDLQINGGFGVEVGTDPDAIRHLAAQLPSAGVTAFLPTVVTSDAAYYQEVYAAFEAARGGPGAQPLTAES